MQLQDNTQQKLSKTEIKTLIISAIGGTLEFYDFIIYVFFAQIIGRLFFETTSVVSSLLLSFSVFASGYLARVFGGIVFSHFGDKNGRKKSFTFTIFLMALPTFCIGILPTYSHLGVIATILLVTCRILQGLAIGGEIPCSITFVYEHAAPKHRAFACGTLFCGLIMGIFLGSLVDTIVTKSLSEQALSSWGWRIPFLFGGLLGFVGVYLRKYLCETPAFREIRNSRSVNIPLLKVIKEYSFSTISSITTILSISVAITLFLLYLPTFLHIYYQFPSDTLLEINSIAVIIFAGLIPFFGKLCDVVSPRKVLNFGLILFILFSYPVFYFLHPNNYSGIYLIYVLVIIASSAITAAGIVLLAGNYPTHIRYSGVSLSYNIAFGVFGGFTPFIATYLIKITNNLTSPSFYMTGVCILALIVSLLSNRISAHHP